MTLQVPASQVGWFEQMIRTMGWSFQREDTSPKAIKTSGNKITPALRRSINKARKESELGETKICRNPEEMQRFFDNL